MTNLITFDILIVYAHALAQSASDTSRDTHTPFPINSRHASYNIVYGYFLEVCEKYGLTAAFTTSDDIINAGVCSSFWTYKNETWYKNSLRCFAPLIFDKFSPVKHKVKVSHKLLFSSNQSKPFNDSALYSLFLDKQKTYNKLSTYAIPTVAIKGTTIQSIKDAYDALTKLIDTHPNPEDFNADIIMKARFGSCGRLIYKFKSTEFKKMLSTICTYPRTSFIFQPFVKFDQGFNYGGHSAATDIRFVYFKGRIVQTYIRVAKPGEFRCNEYQGGVSTYVSLSELPQELVAKANVIATKLDKKTSLYTLDFIISNSGHSYFLEGNTGPGLAWNLEISKEEVECKKIIRMIVKECVLRTYQKDEVKYKKVYFPSFSPQSTSDYPMVI